MSGMFSDHATGRDRDWYDGGRVQFERHCVDCQRTYWVDDNEDQSIRCRGCEVNKVNARLKEQSR